MSLVEKLKVFLHPDPSDEMKKILRDLTTGQLVIVSQGEEVPIGVTDLTTLTYDGMPQEGVEQARAITPLLHDMVKIHILQMHVESGVARLETFCARNDGRQQPLGKVEEYILISAHS